MISTKFNAILSVNTLLKLCSGLLLILLNLITLPAQETYEPVSADPIEDKWRWRHLANLDKEKVFTITEDDGGNIWFGISNGLIKYDGYQFTKFELPKEFNFLRVHYAFSTKSGIFCGHWKGLYHFNGVKWTKIFETANDGKNDLKTGGNRLNPFYSKKISPDITVVGLTIGMLVVHGEELNLYTNDFIRSKLESSHPHVNFYSLDTVFEGSDVVSFKAMFSNSNHYVGYFKVGKPLYKIEIDIDLETAEVNFGRKTKSSLNEIAKGRTFKFESSDSSMWISHLGPLTPLIKKNKTETREYNFSSIFGEDNTTTQVVETKDGTIITGGFGCLYSIKNDVVKKYKYPVIPVSPNSTVNVYKDSKDRLWVINYMAQVFILEYNSKFWQTWPDLSFQMEAKDGSRWFISKDNKIVVHKTHSNNPNSQWYYFDTSDGLMSHPSGIIQTSKGDIWCTGNNNGIAATAFLKKGRWHVQKHAYTWSIDPRSVFEDSKGNLWFSTYQDYILSGLGVFNLQYTSLDSLKWTRWKTPIYTLGGLCERSDTIWGASAIGLFQVSNKNQRTGNYTFSSELDALEKDNFNNIWVGTRTNGVFVMHPNNSQKNFNSSNQLLSNIIVDLHATADSGMWVVTEKDFTYFDGKEWTNNCLPKHLLFSTEGGTIKETTDKTLWISVYSKKWMRQMFGDNKNRKVTDAFYSVSYKKEKSAPETFFTQYRDTVEVDGNVHIQWSGMDKWERTERKDLLFSFKLDNNEWTPFSHETGYTFTSLDEGKHKLLVRAKDRDLNIDPTPANISFIVLPPVWKRPWFISLVAFLLSIITYQWIRIIKRKNRLSLLNLDLNRANSNLEIANASLETKNIEIETQKEKMLKHKDELHQLKLKFFTNISHEFRTPLTLIKGAIESILTNNLNQSQTEKYLGVAKRNSNLLIKLVAEIMEFRKIESGHDHLKAQHIKLQPFLSDITQSFKGLADEKNINFEIKLENDCDIWVDSDKLTRIIYNLLSNAFKFTNEGGFVRIISSQDSLPENPLLINKLEVLHGDRPINDFVEIIIEDNGIGIEEKSIPDIFERFYQEENGNSNIGSGIGLSYTKHAVLLHKADIIVTSKRNQGTRFTLHFPIGNNHLEPTEMVNVSSESYVSAHKNVQIKDHVPIKLPNKTGNNDDDTTTLLIVEDNDDLREYLKDSFQSHYEIMEASDGVEGLEMAMKHIPDLIISDVMMPRMNGNDMTIKIKSDIKTSHIPIILLTARASNEHTIEGFQTGADVYIPKPFDKQALILQVNNLIITRQNFIQRNNSSNVFSFHEIPKNNLDQEFIEKTIEFIKQNIDVSGFGVELLSEMLNMSRKNFYRKLKALTGLSPSEFIQNVRLGIAVEMLKKTNLSINEIVYQSGFSSASYLSKLFKEKFGCTPKEFRVKFQN